jgi:hypothetical protein
MGNKIVEVLKFCTRTTNMRFLKLCDINNAYNLFNTFENSRRRPGLRYRKHSKRHRHTSCLRLFFPPVQT